MISPYQPLPFQIQPMRTADIETVVALEHAAYGPKRLHRDYQRELRQNKLAHHFVLSWVRETRSAIIGQGGFWLIADEIQITSVAIQPRWQHLGLGAWLLIHLLEHGQVLGAAAATLEVRSSNQVAINLYAKFGFQEAGWRSHYFSDTGEDALILTTPVIGLTEFQTMLQRRKTELFQRLARLNIDKLEYLN